MACSQRIPVSLPGESVDLDLCAQALQFLDDRRSALAEMQPVLKQEGHQGPIQGITGDGVCLKYQSLGPYLLTLLC